MWNEPETLLWRLLGFESPVKEHTSFYKYLAKIVFEYIPSLSHVFISEVIGLAVILVFFLKKKMRAKLNA